jgi:2-polyprenyl-3-methyl-5-hydroxy-6-metoxy-1,4-benzoquinol methylase
MNQDGDGFLAGNSLRADPSHYSKEIKFSDHKIKFMTRFCLGKDVLDLGCVMHDPRNYKSQYWLHRAIVQKSKSVIGIDLYSDGVDYLKKQGFNIEVGNVESLNLNKKFDTIIAGDIIEHLNNFEGFFLSCKKHLRKDGVVVISTPNPWHWRYLIRSIFGGEIDIVNPEHTTWFCPKTLRQLASRFSFEVIEIEYGSRFNRELFMPLPKGLKHQSFFTALRLKK